ncbi:predicted protein [Uncinocarpus reesii 1704]|uniref:DUF4045 domain-containing protein n=1 Tax=Uncinocarpus reesii (strain UAMH 1704) TaxID=336963 RepID=C4JY79_UNCRE|nr:uncharacterized protein UREG_07130 [Uncinocarpus reesii 1704]EEP82265.1 predicted protein [Uncinocarpus reesii 1704]
MTLEQGPGGSEDVNDFLVRIRELGEKRDKEDEERTRKLEEEILQGRREREARRAGRLSSLIHMMSTIEQNKQIPQGSQLTICCITERARSISPTKDSPLILDSSIQRDSPLSPSASSQSILPPVDLLPTTKTLDLDLVSRQTNPPSADSDIDKKSGGSPNNSTENSTLSRSRSRAMSWRQRPQSRDIESLASTLKFPGDLPKITPEETKKTFAAAPESVMSRAQIAQSLSSKDPSWFSQTSERGVGSQAYRKSSTTPLSEIQLNAGGIRLPGISKEPTIGAESSYDGSERSRSPSRASSVYGTSSFGNRFSSISSVSAAGGLGSPIPIASASKFEARPVSSHGESQPSDRVTMSPSQTRLASDRASSPTKGLGGFVQSAMMKRSDSVSKRWSVQSGPNTFRNSFISNRGELTPSTASLQFPKPQEPLASQESTSRPGSSHSEATVVRHSQNTTSNTDTEDVKDGAVAPSNRFPRSSFSSYSASRSDSISTPDELPTTPSKTMDPKRWSPTKASWLESALNKPDSPRLKATTTTQGPGWKKDLTHKIRNSRDVGPLPELPLRPEDSREEISGPVGGCKETVPETLPQEPVGTDPEHPAENKPAEKKITQSPAIPPKSQDLESKVRAVSKSNDSLTPSLEKPTSNTSERSPHSLEPAKPAPQKPLVTDFRANLRRREIPTEKSDSQEPEFKNVFGKLRRTETKNYVAPDELKDNILRGKAALNVTGGPKKTARVDEFKESILKQKEAMKAGGGSIRRTANQDRVTAASNSPIPEAIARLNTLGRSDSVKSGLSTPRSTPISPRPLQTNIIPSSFGSESPLPSRGNSPTKQADDVKQAISPQVSPTRAIASKPPDEPDPKALSPISSPEPLVSRFTKETAKGKLAGRLNPALAGILARGPPSELKPLKTETVTISNTQQTPETPSAPLTHITKSRTKGPKRRLPQQARVESPLAPSVNKAVPPDASRDRRPTNTLPTKSASSLEERLEFLNANKQRQMVMLEESRNDSAKARDVADGQLEFLPSTTYSAPKEPIEPLPASSDLRVNVESRDPQNSPPLSFISPSQLDQSPVVQKRTLSHLAEQPMILKIEPGSPSIALDETNSPRLSGLKEKRSRESIPSSVGKRVVSPPVPPKPSTINTIQSNRKSLVPASPFPQTPKAAQMFADFFDIQPSAKKKVDIDPSTILSSRSGPSPKIKTLKKQIWEIGNDGRKKDLPANQEYILFEESMYLCIHHFEASSGSKTTQTHLWCGDGVSEGAIEDAQLFARKVARENNCKLEILRQGKESANFIQALGGIILTRRGSSSRANSSALYMLCGRRHLGQIAFDEVDLTPQSLCSGYPFIISAKFGSLYLWKGQGSTADELGCARLIGMDLGLTGEIEEITEGQEPASFFDYFPGSKDTRTYSSGPHWQCKASSEKYCCRLFRIDHELGQGFGAAFWNRRGANSPVARPNDTVQEIEPFCQRDLDSDHIYVLDAFFEIYVIVGAQAHSRSAEFASALVFAQEYGFLAVSEQDRPFLPKGHVVMHGLTDECKRAFRKWDDRLAGFGTSNPVQLPLNAAIEAIR